MTTYFRLRSLMRPSTPKTLPPLGQHGQRWKEAYASARAVVKDPITPVIWDILRADEILVPEQLARLDIFQPDKVRAALEALRSSPELASDAIAQERLGRLLDESPSATVVTGDHVRSPRAAALAAAIAESRQGMETAPTTSERPETEAIAKPERPLGDVAALPPEAEALAADDLAFAQWDDTPPAKLRAVSIFGQWPESEEGSAPSSDAAFDSDFDSDDLDDTLETVPNLRLGGSGSPATTRNLVATADDLLALPAGDQMKMVAFLKPHHLEEVLQRTDSPDLKRAVIDTLANIGNPDSLTILHRWTEQEQDANLRLYALEAADKIMGTD
jgi:hypothetical protein